MEQKAKFIIIGLAGALAVFIFLFFQAFTSKQVLVREKDDLQKDNQTLSAKLDKLSGELRSRQDEFDGLRRQIDKIGRERDDIQKKYILANKDKEAALEKLKETQQPRKITAAPPAEPPAGRDSYWTGILKVKADLEVQLASVREELKAIQLSNEQLQREKANLELDLNSIKHDNDELLRKLEYNQKLADNLAQDLVREKNDKLKIEESLKAIRNENTSLSRQLKTLNSRKVVLDRKVQDLEDEKDKIQRDYSQAEANLTDKASQIGSLKTQVDNLQQETAEPAAAGQSKDSAVELPPIVVRPQQEAALSSQGAAGLPAGRILSVNKENNFVIIDIGEEAAVQVGHTLRAYNKDDKPVAELEVIQTRKDISACDIKKEYGQFGVGDIVK